MLLILTFLAAACLSFLSTAAVRRVALRFGVVDHPAVAPERKLHTEAIPLLGGIALFFTFFVVVGSTIVAGVDYGQSDIRLKHLAGLLIGSAMLMIGGVVDDTYRLKPWKQLIAPILAIVAVIASGIGITYVSSPFGGPLGNEQLFLTGQEYILFWFRGWPYKITLFADLFTFVWMMGMMYTTKLLDGLDGVVASITIVGAVMIAVLALNPAVGQWETALLALILAGACAGFLIWNWHPARIFLGESGSLFAGFMLGALAIISDSKVATTFLIFSIPILDVVSVIARRVIVERRSPFTGDRLHLHFRLLDLGLSHVQAVLVLVGLAVYFGFGALFIQGRGAFLTFLGFSMALLGLVWWWVRRRR